MSAENVEAVRRLFKAVEERDLAGFLAVYDPELVIREASFLSYGGVYHGHDGGKQHENSFAVTWEKFQPSGERRLDVVFLDAGDRVVALFRLNTIIVIYLPGSSRIVRRTYRVTVALNTEAA